MRRFSNTYTTSKQRNSGTFQVTTPSSLTKIGPGTTIRFIKVSGELVKKSELGISERDWRQRQPHVESVNTISIAVVKVITDHLAIPGECVSLVWSRLSEQLFSVTIVLVPLAEDEWDNQNVWTLNHEEGFVCYVCFKPCHDADEDETRKLNCVRCEPRFLCTRCRIYTKEGRPKCYLCLGPEDLPYVKADQMMRLRVLSPTLFDETETNE